MLSFILLLLTAAYILFIISWYRGWQKIAVFKPVPRKPTTKISVIIPARNEESTISNCLADLLQQDYAAELTEIIVVDDHSEDNTSEIVNAVIKDLSEKKGMPSMKLITMHEGSKGPAYKKNAIRTAIGLSAGELIITTDADCRMSRQWLSYIAAYYEQHQPQLISGPVTFTKNNTFFSKLQTMEFCGLIGIGAASIANKLHSMCNGANIAYRKTAFNEVGGFSGNENIASGDDEFLMHKIAARYPEGVHFIKAEETIVFTPAQQNLASFIQQRKRWVSKSRHYQNRKLSWLMILSYLFNCSLVLSLLAGIFEPVYMQIFLLQFSLKIIAEACFLWMVLGFFRRRELLLLLLPAQIFHVFYVIFIGISGNTGQYEWKGRTINVKTE